VPPPAPPAPPPAGASEPASAPTAPPRPVEPPVQEHPPIPPPLLMLPPPLMLPPLLVPPPPSEPDLPPFELPPAAVPPDPPATVDVPPVEDVRPPVAVPQYWLRPQHFHPTRASLRWPRSRLSPRKLPPVAGRPPVPDPPGELLPLQPTHSHAIVRSNEDLVRLLHPTSNSKKVLSAPLSSRRGRIPVLCTLVRSFAPTKRLTLVGDFWPLARLQTQARSSGGGVSWAQPRDA